MDLTNNWVDNSNCWLRLPSIVNSTMGRPSILGPLTYFISIRMVHKPQVMFRQNHTTEGGHTGFPVKYSPASRATHRASGEIVVQNTAIQVIGAVLGMSPTSPTSAEIASHTPRFR